MKETDYSWAAGYFEGEGYIGTYKPDAKHPKRYLRLAVVQSGNNGIPEDLKRFAEIVEAKKINGPMKRLSHHKDKYTVAAGAGEAKRIMELIFPYIVGPKKEQYLQALEVINGQHS